MSQTKTPFLFEISYEVANFVGGIHTVLATKANQIQKHIPHYILIGPYVKQNADNEFTAKSVPQWMKKHITELQTQGIIAHYGTWNVPGNPNCLLLEFNSQYEFLNEEKTKLYHSHQLESHDGGNDVNEPMALSLAAAKTIAQLSTTLMQNHTLIAHSHEWMCGYTNLFLQNRHIPIKTVFTTHATMLGRTLASREPELMYTDNPIDGHAKATEFGILSKYSAEVACAKYSDVFTTVSDITANEATKLLGIKPDVITYNGINVDELYPLTTLAKTKQNAKNKITSVAKYALGDSFTKNINTQYWVISGRHEPKNKGYLLTIETLAQMQKQTSQQIIVFILVPYEQFGLNAQLQQRIATKKQSGSQFRDLLYYTQNEITDSLNEQNMFNQPDDTVKIIYVPEYLFIHNELFTQPYPQLLTGFDLGIFPSYYEPWGYTPHECAGAAVGVVTSNTAGFGQFIEKHIKEDEITLINRQGTQRGAQIDELKQILLQKANRNEHEILHDCALARQTSKNCEWREFISAYVQAYDSVQKNKTI